MQCSVLSPAAFPSCLPFPRTLSPSSSGIKFFSPQLILPRLIHTVCGSFNPYYQWLIWPLPSLGNIYIKIHRDRGIYCTYVLKVRTDNIVTVLHVTPQTFQKCTEDKQCPDQKSKTVKQRKSVLTLVINL